MTLRLGAATGCCVSQPILDTLDGFRDAGVTSVEIGTPPRHFDPWSHLQVREVGARLGQLAIAPVSIHAPFGGLLDLSEPNPHHRHAAIGAIVTAASAIRELGGAFVVAHVTDVVREGQDVEERLAHCAGSFQVLARALQQMQATLLIETPLPHLIGGHPDEFAWLLGHLDRSVGVCIDTGHVSLGHHWDRFVETSGDRLRHIHVNDNRGRFDDHLPPGEGDIDWRHIRDTLRRISFDGWVMLELACPRGPVAGYVAHAMTRAVELLG
jgi:sugar phosphate isomerase/epimerase